MPAWSVNDCANRGGIQVVQLRGWMNSTQKP
jgi:hypothetical protein